MAKLICPDCQSDEIKVYERQAWDLNKEEFLYHSTKLQDCNAEVVCRTCEWVGERRHLKESQD